MGGADRNRDKVPMPSPVTNLSARLLVLTAVFVMLGEVLIYVPSVSRYRLVYLQERLAAAHEATLALSAAPDGMISPELEQELLRHARVRSVALRMPDAAYLMLGAPPPVDATFDLRDPSPPWLIRDAFVALGQTENRVLRVVGPSRVDPTALVDVTLDEAPMRAEMFDYSGRILLLSIVLSLITAALVYLSLHRLMVRPMHRITENLIVFRERPEDASRDLGPSMRRDEIGVVQRELTEMQRGLRVALTQRAHLVALGSAVSKINHDLRNILSSAVLVTDRLAHADDPEVRKQARALMTAIDRAVALCEATLDFSRAGGPKPRRETIDLAALVDEVGATLSPVGEARVRWRNEINGGIVVEGDRDQLFRAVLNLGRNAIEAIDGAGEVRVTGRDEGGRALIEIADSGPGLPEKARAHLFEPFAGSVRDGGTGLGLPIAREILRAHGGDLALIKSDAGGSVFRLSLPRG